MDCEHVEILLSPYLEDELSQEERQIVDAHIPTCSSCSDLLSLISQTQESLATFPEIEVSENLAAQLYELPFKRKKFQLVTDFLLRPAFQPIMAAATVLLVCISFYAFHPDKTTLNRSIERQFKIGFGKVEKLYAEAESITHTLGEYKDSLIVSIKNFKPFRGNDDEQPKS